MTRLVISSQSLFHVKHYKELTMSTRTTIIVSLIVILAATIASAIVYPHLPEMAASHWNAAGQVDGSMPRFWAAFLMPLVSVGLLLLFLVIPSIDPLKANIVKFRGYFNGFITLIIVFMLFIHGVTLAWNLGYDQFNIGNAIVPAVGLIFIFAGVMMMKTKRNFFIGIRTPWTLSNDTVWEETHKLGGKLFIGAGIITMLAMFFGENGIWILLPVALLAGFVPVVYSYFLWRRISKS
jgi:immunity protein, SdpI family